MHVKARARRVPTPHVSWHELDCHDGTPYPPEWFESRLIAIAIEFEFLRHRLGDVPVVIGSGYRHEAYNRRVGGAKLSQHVQGRAFDLYPPKGRSVDDLLEAAIYVQAQEGSRIRGIGVYPTHVHIDTRPADRLYRWWGKRTAAELVDRLVSA